MRPNCPGHKPELVKQVPPVSGGALVVCVFAAAVYCGLLMQHYSAPRAQEASENKWLSIELKEAEWRFPEKYREALQFGPSDPRLVPLLGSLAGEYAFSGKRERALRLQRYALQITQESFGMNDLRTAEQLIYLAGLHDSHGDNAEAIRYFQQALAIQERMLGRDHPQNRRILADLAELYVEERKFARAVPLFERAVGMYESSSDKDDQEYAATLLGDLASACIALGDDRRAERLLLRQVDWLRVLHNGDSIFLARGLEELAELYARHHQDAKAYAAYSNAWGIFHSMLSTEDSMLAGVRDRYAQYLRNSGRVKEARKVEQVRLDPVF